MKAIMRCGAGKTTVIDKETPKPAHGEVIVKVACSGICGSDIHRFTEDIEKWDKLILGHEFSGIISSLADDVQGYKMGDRVSAAPLIPCHHCEYCYRGEYSLCRNYSFVGSRIDGSFAEYIRLPARNLIALGEDFPLEKGAFVEPLTVCLHPIMRLGSLLGKTVVVTGLGTIGLLALQVFRAIGARRIIASDIVEEKLKLAKDLGATHTVNPAGENLEKLLDQIGGAHIVFESSGTNPAKLAAIRIAKGRGSILLVGTSPRDISFDAALFEQITRKELNLIGSWMNYSAPWPGDEWRSAVWMLKEGIIKTDSLITRRCGLNDFQKGLEIILDPQQFCIKTLLIPGQQ